MTLSSKFAALLLILLSLSSSPVEAGDKECEAACKLACCTCYLTWEMLCCMVECLPGCDPRHKKRDAARRSERRAKERAAAEKAAVVLYTEDDPVQLERRFEERLLNVEDLREMSEVYARCEEWGEAFYRAKIDIQKPKSGYFKKGDRVTFEGKPATYKAPMGKGEYYGYIVYDDVPLERPSVCIHKLRKENLEMLLEHDRLVYEVTYGNENPVWVATRDLRKPMDEPTLADAVVVKVYPKRLREPIIKIRFTSDKSAAMVGQGKLKPRAKKYIKEKFTPQFAKMMETLNVGQDEDCGTYKYKYEAEEGEPSYSKTETAL